jgi:hypothetical protein
MGDIVSIGALFADATDATVAAVRDALGDAPGLRDAEVAWRAASRLWQVAPATRTAVMCAVAASAVAVGELGTVLLLATRGASSVAVVLSKGRRHP